MNGQELLLVLEKAGLVEPINRRIINDINAKGLNVERLKARKKKHSQSEKGKAANKKYRESEIGKENHRKNNKKYDNQLCMYNGETLTLRTLKRRFKRAGIILPGTEAKKYLI